MQEQRVQLGERSYSIYTERGLLPRIAGLMRRDFHPTQICLVSDETVAALYGQTVQDSLEAAGFPVLPFRFPAGEASKRIETAEALIASMLDASFDRKSMIVALGGGVTGDLAGFAAAIYKRGIDFVQIPTTVIAQTDSSVGGKTGVDFGGLKNVVGAFHQPRAVYIDPETLRTLPRRVLCEGLGEVVKYAVLSGGDLYARVCAMQSPEDFLNDACDIVDACVAYKRRVVEEDELDNGKRMLLNLGHTLGHAIEGFYHYGTYTHGEAVAIGLWEITRYAAACGLLRDPAMPQQLLQLLRRLQLPTRAAEENRRLLFARVGNDKKKNGAHLSVLIPAAPGDVRIVETDAAEFLGKIIALDAQEAGDA